MGEVCWTVRRVTRRRLVGRTAVGASVVLFGLGAAPDVSTATQDRNKTIVLIPGEGGNNYFYIPMACGAQAAADQLGITLDVQGPAYWDAALQTELLAKVVATKPDAILIVPNDRTALVEPIQQAVDAGIAVFTLDTFIDADLAVANIASDNVEGGRIAAQVLATAIGDRGKVFVVNVIPGISSTDQREQGFAEEIKTHPNIAYLGQEYCDGDQGKAAAIVSAKLEAEPDLVGIFGTNLDAAQGAALGVKQAGATDRVSVAAFDAGPDQVDQLRAGTVDALIAQHPYDMGYEGVKLAVAYLDTEEPLADKVVSTGYTVITRDNLEDADVAHRLYGLDCSEIPAASPTAATPTS